MKLKDKQPMLWGKVLIGAWDGVIMKGNVENNGNGSIFGNLRDIYLQILRFWS